MRAKNLIFATLGLFLTSSAAVALTSCDDGGGSCVGEGSTVFENQCAEDTATGQCRAWDAAELNGHAWAFGLGSCDARGYPAFCKALDTWYADEDDCRADVNLSNRPSASSPSCYTFCPENDSVETCEAFRGDRLEDDTIDPDSFESIPACNVMGEELVLPDGADYCAHFTTGADLSEDCIDDGGFVELVVLQADDAPESGFQYSCRLDGDPDSCG